MQVKHLFLVIALVTFWFIDIDAKEVASTKGYTIIQDQAALPIKTPSFSERKVRKIQLDNGLQAILISDPKTDQSAAALAVQAGSWQDPDAYPGIAHFLEHMLFLGTNKYPKESEYQKYITEHGGYSNAFTTNDYTSYIFSIDNDFFPEAMDRFSSFFKEPLFNPSGVSRELNAIDQEYAKNYENDDIREIMVMREIENPAHPNFRFTMGNSQTLGAVSQETLKKWYQDHYSANIMRLYVISKLPLDSLVELVVKDFSTVPNYQKEPFVTDIPLTNPHMEGKYFYIEPIKNVRTVTLVWDLPQIFWEMKDTRPDKLICHILGHEGKESLLAELKREKLAEGLSCNTFDIGGKNLVFFVEVDLTDDGITHVDHVILRCFQTLALLKDTLFPQYIFDEVKHINILDYEYQKRDDAFSIAMKNAAQLTGEDLSTYPEQTEIIQKFNAENVRALLDFLTPENMRILIKAPSALTGVEPTHKETWLNVPYAIKPVPAEIMKEWKEAKPISAITLPPANPFLPKSLDLVEPSSALIDKLPLVPYPKLIVNSGHGDIYYAKDQRYLVPQLYLYFNIKTPAIDKGKAAKVVLADMYVKALEEALSKFSYPATVAGLNFSVDRTDFGVSIKITGYNDNAALLFDEILKQLKDVVVTEPKFKLYKQALLRDYLNFNKETPLKRVKELLHSAIYKNYATQSQKAAALRKLSFAKFDEDVQGLFKQAFVEGLIYGNVSDEQAQAYANLLLKTLNNDAYPKAEQKKAEVIVLPNEGGPFLFETNIPAQGNATLLAIENPHYTFKNRAAQQILMTAMNEPFFSQLRTKQQTGYLVFSTGEEIERKLFNAFIVQSNTHDPRDLLARFELFIEGFLQEMGKTVLTEENFETIRKSLLEELEKPQNNMEAMGTLLQTLAFKYEGHFDWMDKRIQGFKELTYPEFLSFSKEFMGKENRRRLGLLVKGTMDKHVLNYDRVTDLNQLKKISTFSPAFTD